MPNYCWNNVTMRNIAEGDYFRGSDDHTKEFDFEKITPMPESLDITSPADDLAINMALEVIIRGVMTDRFKFGLMFPNQKNIAEALAKLQVQLVQDIFSDKQKGRNVEYSIVDNQTVKTPLDDNQLIMKGLQYLNNIVKYGYPTWYDWCCKNWGTKWNAWDTYINSVNNIEFTTAWSPPDPIFLELSKRNPYDLIDVSWVEEGGTCGILQYHGGECICDKSYIIERDDNYDWDTPHLFDRVKQIEEENEYE